MYGVETYDANMGLLFSSRHHNVFVVDRITLNGPTTVRSYNHLTTRIGCQLIYTGPVTFTSYYNYYTNWGAAGNTRAARYAVNYSSGYPVLTINWVGAAGVNEVVVYTWGEAI